MLKRSVVLVVLLALVLSTFATVLPARAQTIRITLNGQTLATDVPPIIRDGRTLVPFRAIFEALGASVEWDPAANAVRGFNGPAFVLLQPDSRLAYSTGKAVNLDVPATIISGRTMVPLRFVSEAMGAQVEWIPATSTVAITHRPETPQPIIGKQGEFATVYSGELTTLNYLVTATTAEQLVGANIVETLVEYDRLGILRPALARFWTISPDGLTYTFHLRQGVNWYTHDGKFYAETTAQDFVDAARYVLTSANASRTASLMYVLRGAEAFFKGESTDFNTVGVKALDKYTVQYTLRQPVPYFMSMLTYVCFFPANGKFLDEVQARFGTDHRNLLSNGPYILTNHAPQNIREFVKNPNYWDKDNVFVTKLTYRFNREAATLAPELFIRGEISSAGISTAILDAWLQDPVRKDLVRPSTLSNFTFWYGFNFDPKFAAEYEPANWSRAVRNINFRKAIYHGLDRVSAMLTFDPYNPERQLRNTITPTGFASVGGLDYTQLPPLAGFSNTNPFNRTLALNFRNLAQVELRAAGATFPVKVMMPFNTGSTDWVNRVQVIEQQLENLLGKGFIDIIPVGFAATGFLDATRRAGNYALQEVNWGPDYADPQTFTDPFVAGNPSRYSDIALVDSEYQKLLDAAKSELLDVRKRYELFAKAEARLIEQALVIPYRCGGGGYVASMFHPFSASFAPFGVSTLKFKGQLVLDRPMNMQQFDVALAQWEKDRTAALRRWGQ